MRRGYARCGGGKPLAQRITNEAGNDERRAPKYGAPRFGSVARTCIVWVRCDAKPGSHHRVHVGPSRPGCGDAGSAGDIRARSASALNATSPANGRMPTHIVTLGLHDGAINFCDNFEKWGATPPDYAATAADMGDASWWTPLHVGTVRVSVPWDIAVAWNYAADVLLSEDPSGAVGGGQWGNNHLAALKNEQTCFDYWLNAANERWGRSSTSPSNRTMTTVTHTPTTSSFPTSTPTASGRPGLRRRIREVRWRCGWRQLLQSR